MNLEAVEILNGMNLEGQDDAYKVALMLAFFYEGQYPGTDQTMDYCIGVASDKLVDHAVVFAMAVKYDVPTLQQLAVTKFKDQVDILEEDDDDADVADLAHTIPIVFASTPDSPSTNQLRDEIKRFLVHDYRFKHWPAVRTAVDSVHGLAYDLLILKDSERIDSVLARFVPERGHPCLDCPPPKHAWRCPNCKVTFRRCLSCHWREDIGGSIARCPFCGQVNGERDWIKIDLRDGEDTESD